MQARRYLFLSGAARSGTTALGRILGFHPDIALGLERFKYLMQQNTFADFQPALFEEDRFFDFSDGHTNLVPEDPRYGPYYAELQQRYQNARYVGDKVPNTFRRTREIHKRFPNAHFVIIFRSIFDVAHSWESRATDVNDQWRAGKDGSYSLIPWNGFVETFRDMKARFPEQFHAVDYEQFFGAASGDTGPLDQLMQNLELDSDSPTVEAYERAKQVFQERVAPKARVLDEEMARHIRENALIDEYEEIFTRAA